MKIVFSILAVLVIGFNWVAMCYAGIKPEIKPQTSKVIRVTDFGVKPDSRINAVRGVRAAIEACRNESSATLVFPKGRYLCGHADGFQVSNCRGHIVVDGCKFEGLMDDPINVHGTSVKIIEMKGRNGLVCNFMEGMSTGMAFGGVGDKVGFIENKSMVTLGHDKIKAYTKINRDRFEV